MEKLKVKERERITHQGISLDRYKDLAFRACDKSKSYCRPLVKYPPVESVPFSSEEEKSRPVEL
jgi:hypothetical protein